MNYFPVFYLDSSSTFFHSIIQWTFSYDSPLSFRKKAAPFNSLVFFWKFCVFFVIFMGKGFGAVELLVNGIFGQFFVTISSNDNSKINFFSVDSMEFFPGKLYLTTNISHLKNSTCYFCSYTHLGFFYFDGEYWCNFLYGKLKYELRVENIDVVIYYVEIKHELQVTSYEFKSTSHELKSTSYEFESTS